MAHNNLGAMLKRRGQLEEAIAEYRKVLECDPYQIMARNNLGDILANRGQFDEAVAEYRKALEIDPGCMAVHYNLANTLKNRARRRGRRRIPQGAEDRPGLPGGSL